MAEKPKRKEAMPLSLFADTGKIPPQSPDLEISVLGAILMDASVLRDISLFLRPECFYNDANAEIYRVMLSLYHSDKPIDMLIVCEELKKTGKIEDIGGKLYVVGLTDKISTPFQALFHAQIVYQKFLYREMIKICGWTTNRCYEELDDIDDIIEQATDKITAMLSMKKRKDVCDFKQTLDAAAAEIDNNTTQESNIFTTGHKKFDEYYALKENTLFLLAGDRGTAKTNYLCDIGKNLITLNDNVYILWFSMEDPKEKIVRRFISSECGLSDRKLLSIGTRLTDEEKARAMAAYDKVSKMQNVISFIDQKVDIMFMRKCIRKYTEVARSIDKKLIVIVDNFGLIDVPGIKDDVARDNALIGELVSIRAESKALIILIHHLNKSLHLGGLKEGFRPLDNNIRGSGKILDYVNQCALVNLPKKYPTLVEAYKKTSIEMPDEIPINSFEIFKDTFLKLNNMPCKYTKSAGIADVSVGRFAFDKFTDIIMVERSFDDGTEMNALELYKRWMLYVTEKENLNAERDAKYRVEIPSLYAYLDKKIYNYTNRLNKESRDYYLFGGRELSNDKKYEMLQKVFIVDAVKIRDFDTEGDSLIHYEVDLNANVFTEII